MNELPKSSSTAGCSPSYTNVCCWNAIHQPPEEVLSSSQFAAVGPRRFVNLRTGERHVELGCDNVGREGGRGVAGARS